MKDLIFRKIYKFFAKASVLKSLLFSCFLAFFSLVPVNVAYAGKLQASEFYKGTLQLLNDATSAINILAPLVTIIVVVYYFARKSAADEMDYKKWDTRIKIALICGVGIETASLLINLFVSYYK